MPNASIALPLGFHLLKFPVLFFCFGLAWSCQGGSASAQTAETAVGKVDPTVPLRQEADDRDRPVDALILRMGSAVAAPGAKVCLPVEATGFKELIGFQFTVRFDSAALKFQSVRELSLPGYRVENFGVRFADRGYLSTLWTDFNLSAATLPDGTKLFEVCFENLQKKGQETEVKFQNGPTAFEVIRKDMEQLRFVYANGKVKTE
ncbi:cohesin domain-containing protein [Neolewinella lacunae]|uniref:Cohesin domain-containing protein n=1 Tax=Neolewinella lacunae TaxID=1517758 RepID=A0A923PS75_9BACT|nr:cohesin domain-containing protein [Neolewinella lacunae]MBC6996513.1 hypothetical protein [Neolewinella lacunae]MDN3636666.1 cohesin domain-containing protein [Neolewinella lacunae]